MGNREKSTSSRAPSGNATRHQGLLSPRWAHSCRLPAPPQPARASLPASLPFPTRNKQPAVPAAAARDANRAPGASPAGGGRRGAGSGAGGTRELAQLPPRSGAGPRQGRRETGLSVRPPSLLPLAVLGAEGRGAGPLGTPHPPPPGRSGPSPARLSQPRRERCDAVPRAASSAFEPPSQRQSPPHNAPRRAAFEKAARLVQDGGARPVA